MLNDNRNEVARLFQEYAHSHPFEPEGLPHVERYKKQLRQGRENFGASDMAAKRGEDVP
jgi:hypothetical protein